MKVTGQSVGHYLAKSGQGPENFLHLESCSKISNLRLHSCFIYIFLILTEVPFIQEVSGVYTFLFLDKDKLKLAFRA